VDTRESGKDRVTVRLNGPQAVTEASTAARAFAEAEWLAEDETARLCIIIEEIIANLYDHGGVGQDDEVVLSLEREPRGILVTILDPGTPFDPRQPRKKPDSHDRGGGAGIEIVHSWALVTSYEATNQGNRLELLLPLQT
jgi:anti-sigma regulatory factor (Ser/Thr protein kinase)